MQLSDPGRIQRLLSADEVNTRVSPDLMRSLHPWAHQGFDDTADMFRALYSRLGSWNAEDAEEDRLRNIARGAGLSDPQLVERLKAGTATPFPGAAAAYAKLWTFRVAKIVVLACQRYWACGAADLFRLRITSALGHLRLEAESVGLLALFFEDDTVADRWSRIMSQRQGRTFYNETQPRIKHALRRYNLANTYDIASNSALHVRMAGVVRSLATENGEISLPDQDFDKDHPYSFHLAVGHYHRVQGRVFEALGSVLPGIPDSEWTAQRGRFTENAAKLWQSFERTYEDTIREQGRPDETDEGGADGAV